MTTCETCLHWHKQQTNPLALDQRWGQCRAMPPQIVQVATDQRGNVTAQLNTYPITPAAFPACGLHAGVNGNGKHE